MAPKFLLPENIAHEDGSGAEVALGPDSGKPLLLTLGITRILEQESLEVSVWGSPEGEKWKALASFPQKFYCGTYSLLLDLARHPDVRFLRTQWKMSRWQRVQPPPLFAFYVSAEQPKLHAVGA